MKKQPTISTISKKMPTRIFSQIMKKFQEKIQNYKNVLSQKTNSDKPSSGEINLEYYRSESDGDVYFEWAGLGFDKYGNGAKW